LTCSRRARYKAGQKEVQILYRLRQTDPEDKKHVVRLERTFEHRGHLCLVFESLRSLLSSIPSNVVLTFPPTIQYESA
jgi:serine/threonine-protein kinase PRP4